MATCLVVQHVAPERAFLVEEALRRAGVTVTTCRVFAGDPVPNGPDSPGGAGDVNGRGGTAGSASGLAGLDGLVVMGGPMSATSDAGFPTRRAELSLLAAAVRAGIPVLGVCLGAQLLALAAGGTVARGEAGPEIGWHPVDLAPAAGDDPLFASLPSPLTVLHWHGDTYGLPPGAVRLAGSRAYPEQAFRVGPAAWGLQFHLEVTEPAVAGFLDAFGAEAEDRPGGAAGIRAATPAALHELGPSGRAVLDRFAALVAAPARAAAPSGPG